MIRRILFSALFIAMGISMASAQKYPITIGPKGNTFYYNGAPIINKAHLKDYIYSSDEALRHFRMATTNEVFSYIFAFSGGFLVGWPLGTLIGGGDPEWYLLGIGAGLIVIGITLDFGRKNQLIKAVNAYNGSLDTVASAAPGYTLSFSATPGGLGLMLTF